MLTWFRKPPPGWIKVEGPLLVAEALDAGLEPRAFVVEAGSPIDASLLERLPPGLPGGRVEAAALRTLTEVSTSALGLFAAPEPARPPQRGLVVVLEEVQDPGNAGTILRSALAFGAAAALVRGGARPDQPKVVRASAGAVFRLPLLPAAPWPDLVGAGDVALVADAHEGRAPEEVALGARTFLVFGNERRGPRAVPPGAVRVRVPTVGPVESLNVGAAAAILLYVLSRRQGAAPPPERGAPLARPGLGPLA